MVPKFLIMSGNIDTKYIDKYRTFHQISGPQTNKGLSFVEEKMCSAELSSRLIAERQGASFAQKSTRLKSACGVRKYSHTQQFAY